MKKIQQESIESEKNNKEIKMNLEKLKNELVSCKEVIYDKNKILEPLEEKVTVAIMEISSLKVFLIYTQTTNNELKETSRSLTNEINKLKEEGKQYKELINVLNNNRIDLENQLKMYKNEKEKFSKEFDEFASMRKELKEKNIECLKNAFKKAIA